MELRKHQQDAVARARTQRHLALFLETGTGKTATTIRILCEEYTRQQKVVNTLIFAPLSVCAQWKEEFNKFAPKVDQTRIHILTGSSQSRVKPLKHSMDMRQPAIVVTNYEAVRVFQFYELLLQWCPKLLVLDESHRVKTVSSNAHRRIKPIAVGAERRFILSGTPMPNGLMDIYGQFTMLDPALFSYPNGQVMNDWKFKNHYFYNKLANAPSNVTWKEWVPKENAERDIGEIISKAAVRVPKHECIDLPPLTKVPVAVEMDTTQARAYKSMEKTFVAELNDVVSIAEFAMTKTIRLQQIVCGFLKPMDDDAPEWFDENPRLDALKEILESIGDEKVIIWTIFHPTYKKIAEICEKMGLKYEFIVGTDDQGHKQTVTERMEAIKKFRHGDSQVVISNPAAGSEGINLYEAKYAIYFMRGYNALHYEQSEGRNYRGGSEMHEKVVHYHLYTPRTIDEVILHALKEKKNLSEAVFSWAKELDKSKRKPILNNERPINQGVVNV